MNVLIQLKDKPDQMRVYATGGLNVRLGDIVLVPSMPGGLYPRQGVVVEINVSAPKPLANIVSVLRRG